MTIFFTASYFGKQQHQKSYDLVLDALEQHDIKVISPEKGNYQQVLTKKQLATLLDPKERHYYAIKKGIEQADAVIFETSHSDFHIGFEAAYALESKKYVLALSLHDDMSDKIKHPFFKAAHYSEVTIDNVIEDFLLVAERNHLSERYNFYLSPTQLTFIKKDAQRKGVNTSEYLRLLIDIQRSR